MIGGLNLFGYVYPLLNLFWMVLIFFGVALMFFFIVWCFVDNTRRRDHHGWAKFGWTVFILFFPILGAWSTSSLAQPTSSER